MGRRVALALFLLFAATGAAALADCRAWRGSAVTLFGGVDDPDVLAWDSRDRLLQYAAGTADTREFLLPHALLNGPGTRAIVQACIPGIVHSKFRMAADDAVGVLIRSGRHSGRYGWVSSADLHGRVPDQAERW